MKFTLFWFIAKGADYLTTWYGIRGGSSELNPLINVKFLWVYLLVSTGIIYLIEKRYKHWAVHGMLGVIIGITGLVACVNLYTVTMI
jgi:hypothetical protein